MLLLQALRIGSQDFQLFYEDASHSLKVDEMDKLKAFRYPLVTYLTGTTFRALRRGLDQLCQQFSRDVDEIDLSIAADFFRLVSSNFRALNLCGLRLGDLLPDAKD